MKPNDSLAKDFNAFLKRGNVLDLAVGVMIGGAFGKIVSSFVADILTPPIGLLVDEVNFSALKFHLGGPSSSVTINYGAFFQALLDFLLIATVLFAVVSFVNRLRRQEPQPAVLTKDQELLTEIRDRLRAGAGPGRTVE
ncbi:MAG: hypothetical protein RIQ79_1873 [Verrucomicrobiota bacterium]|jgi:large conductance mechanosensitive channel